MHCRGWPPGGGPLPLGSEAPYTRGPRPLAPEASDMTPSFITLICHRDTQQQIPANKPSTRLPLMQERHQNSRPTTAIRLLQTFGA